MELELQTQGPEGRPLLAARFIEALALANELHGADRRKGTDIPYVAHLLAVCALVLEDGGDEDQAVAALLHDSVEDKGGLAMAEVLRERFGERVVALVLALSDTTLAPEKERRSWHRRKREYLRRLETERDTAVLRISLADKLHNSRTILRDLRRDGDALWERFRTRSADDQLWYYEALVAVFRRVSDSVLLPELAETVAAIREEVERNRRRPAAAPAAGS